MRKWRSAAFSALSATPFAAGASAAPDMASAHSAPGYLIVDPSQAVSTAEGLFYPTGPIDDSTLVVIPNPDGSLPGGLTREKLDAMTSRTAADSDAGDSSARAATEQDGEDITPDSGHTYFAYSSIDWSTPTEGDYVVGFSDETRTDYTFDVFSDGEMNFGQGLGYYRGYNGSTIGIQLAWYGLGYADKTHHGGASVPWGDVAASTQFRAKCGTGPTCTGDRTP
ncbi:hypothetical protein [Clavibacter capsici]|uniref:Uncharacterized protein n=1 Tax=Clavibacter capsici TaxID=1874630 RepID=A0AAE7CC97_9MICO|nr:hypothetical protein [Clavibacter capsici]QIS44400.1 hypothetical protein GW570_04490 [Clavibacter capsici]